MLPLFVLGSAAVGLTLAATPWLAFNRSRPILASVALETSPSILRASRTEQYFAKRPDLQTPYQSAAALLGAYHARRVGLVTTGSTRCGSGWGLAGTGRPDQATHGVVHGRGQTPRRLVSACR